MAELKLYNSLTRKKDHFEPLDPSHIRIYACGPTVYNFAHIGNARMAVIFDVLSNLLRTRYPKVTYVSNITDIDDKIIAASRETNEKIETITQKYTDIYNTDMAALGVKTPDVQPHATDHIPHMIALIEKLIEDNHAYAADRHVLFHVPSFAAYGKLSGRNRDEQIAGARVEIASYKKDPADFVLWKPSSGEEPGWDSPWGFGRPGWHIECSAMAQEHLGLPLDIHGGGADLKFPHHENEIAQSCCAHGDEKDISSFAKYWVHNGFVTVDGEKMSKSLGNVTLAHDLIKNHDGEALRLALLSAHYRQPLDWTADRIHETEKFIKKIRTLWKNIAHIDAKKPQKEEEHDPEILAAFYDDLNTPLAFAKINALLSRIKNGLNTKNIEALETEKYQLKSALDLLGVSTAHAAQQNKENTINSDHIEKLIQERNKARTNKDYGRSDEIRDILVKMNIAIEDTENGTIWKKI